MSDGRSWAAEQEDRWDAEDYEKEKILSLYTKQDLSKILTAIERDAAKEEYLELKSCADGVRVPKKFLKLDISASDIRKYTWR